jgi:chromate transporter
MELVLEILDEFGQMSLLAFGGAGTVLPEMHRRVVEAQAWVTSEQFSQLYGLAQAAPGPNMLIVSLLGWTVAGWSGALAGLVGMCLPSSVLAYAVARVWHRQQGARWRSVLSEAMTPVTVGLTLASAWLITLGAGQSAGAYFLTAATAASMFFARVHPLWAIGAGALLGYAGLI